MHSTHFRKAVQAPVALPRFLPADPEPWQRFAEPGHDERGYGRCLVRSGLNPAAVICVRAATPMQITDVGGFHEVELSLAGAPWRRNVGRLRQATR